jgi:hypothetical protein
VAGGWGGYYYVPQGSENALFGSGVTLQVTMSWNGTTANLYLNGTLVKSTAYTTPTASWTAASNFDLGGYQYLMFGGYDVLDDVIGDFTVTGPAIVIDTTPSGPQTLLQIQGTAGEVSGATNGSVVTPTVTPGEFTGKVVVNNGGSVNFAAGGNGVYFLNCCKNTDNAYYQFTGATIGNIFNVSQGQVTFNLLSRYSFSQRGTSASTARYAFDVRDGNGNHLFYFVTQVESGYLTFSYLAAGAGGYYYVPQGTENMLFGSGVTLRVMLSWTGTTVNLYLNGTLVKSAAYTTPTPSWTAASNFDLGGYQYLTFGGYDALDDVIGGFTVTGPAR